MRTLLPLLVLLSLQAVPSQAQTLLRSLYSPTIELGSQFGKSVAAVPDADDDGVADIVAGAYGEDVGSVPGAGRAHLLSGATGALLHSTSYPRDISNSFYGEAVAGLPDVDGDGAGDFAVGGSGVVYVYSGRTGANLYVIAQQPNAVIGFGRALAGLPDLNDDGRGEILVGCFRADIGAAQTGRVFVFSGKDGAILHTIDSPSKVSNGRFGHAVAAVPDADNDGFMDIAVASTGELAGRGQIHLFSGKSGGHLLSAASPNSQSLGRFAHDVGAVEDVNGDGRGDLIAMAYGEDADSLRASGRAYLFSGADGALLHTLQSPQPIRSGQFGFSGAGVADLDGDGFGDVIVGAKGEGGDAGRAYLFSGATGAVIATLESPTPRDGSDWGFGTDVAGLPDVNGDGLPDFLIAAPVEFAGPDRIIGGHVHLYSGMLGTAIDADEEAPVQMTLSVAPNPATGPANVLFTVERPGAVRIEVYDLLGRRVAAPLDGYRDAGSHRIDLDTAHLAAGPYLLRLTSRSGSLSAQMIVVR